MPKKKVKKTTTTVVTEEIISTDEKTQIICVLDRSQSMYSMIDEAISAFNEFIKDQKKLGDDATMTVALFDDRYEVLYDNVNIKDVALFNREVWSPRGMTALYDAIGNTITTVKETHKKLKKKDRPDKVLFCIVTDGEENCSQKYNVNAIKEQIAGCENEGWGFVYLGANQDAFAVGTSLGFSGGNTFTFTADGTGAKNVSASLNNISTYYRFSSVSDTAFMANNDSLMDNFGVKSTVDVDEDNKGE